MEKIIKKTVRFSEKEYEEIEKKRDELSLSFSEYIRLSISEDRIKIQSKTDEKLLYEINKIGTNINQVAKYCNSKRHIANLHVLINIENQLERIIEDML